MQSNRSKTIGIVSLGLVMGACGDDPKSGSTPWSNQRTEVILASREVVEVDAASGSDCVDYAGSREKCLKPQEKCGKNGADILLDADGQLLDYICYPGEATLTVEEVEAASGIAQRKNDAVVLLDDLDDGADITGDVTIDANNVTLYGEDPAHAVIAGSVTLDGNNAFLRGVTVEQDVTVLKNNVRLLHCVIRGNLVVQGNNAEIYGCDVLGSVTLTGQNAKFYGNRVVGTLSGAGDCLENFAAVDADGDGSVDSGSAGARLTCTP